MFFFDELRRRNVLRVAGLYLVGAWLAVQVASTVLPAFDLPDWVLRALITVLAIGFLPALIFAWVFELTPEGLKREKHVAPAESITRDTGRRLDRIIIVVLALALGYFAFDKFVLSPARERSVVESAREEVRAEKLVEAYGDKSIAVLPFLDLSPDKDQEYFSDGIAEELLDLLTKVPQLRVISRSSAFSFKGQNIEVPEIAKRLGVAHVLEGSVRKAGDRVRITAQLIDARSDTHLWSETYDRTLDDVFATQDEIATAVVTQMKITLLGAPPKEQVTDPAAYRLFLQGREVSRQGTAAGLAQSKALFEQALAIDPRYAAAWAALSNNYRIQAEVGMLPIDDGYRLARDAASKALGADPDCAPAYVARSRIAMEYDRDLAVAAEQLEHALALEPANLDVIRGAAILEQALARLEAALALHEYALARDPVNSSSYSNLASVYAHTGRTDDGIAAYRTALRLAPGRIGSHYYIAETLLLKGEPQAALEVIEEEPDAGWRRIGLPMIYHSLGRQADSDAALAELINSDEQNAAYNIAYVLAWRGETDPAFEWLNKAAAYRDPGLIEINNQPMFASIEQDPRWLAFLHEIGMAPEQLAAIRFDVKLPE